MGSDGVIAKELGFFSRCDENVLALTEVMVAHACEWIKTIELHALKSKLHGI